MLLSRPVAFGELEFDPKVILSTSMKFFYLAAILKMSAILILSLKAQLTQYQRNA